MPSESVGGNALAVASGRCARVTCHCRLGRCSCFALRLSTLPHPPAPGSLLMAVTPSHPAASAVCAGCVMSARRAQGRRQTGVLLRMPHACRCALQGSHAQPRPAASPVHCPPRAPLPCPPVMLGVILAHTGTVALALIQPHTSCRISQSWAGAGSEGKEERVGSSSVRSRSCMPTPMVQSPFEVPAPLAANAQAASTSAVVRVRRAAHLSHGHAHLALRHAVGAGEVDLKGVHPRLLAPLNQLLPLRAGKEGLEACKAVAAALRTCCTQAGEARMVPQTCAAGPYHVATAGAAPGLSFCFRSSHRRLVELLHDGRNQDSVGELLLQLLELLEHHLQRTGRQGRVKTKTQGLRGAGNRRVARRHGRVRSCVVANCPSGEHHESCSLVAPIPLLPIIL